MKKRTLRTIPLSQKWRKLVIKNSGLPSTREIDQIILKSWVLGYSHKDAVSRIKAALA